MVDSIFKDPTSQAGIRALLKTEAQQAAEEHQKNLEDKNSPSYDAEVESTTCEVKLEIFEIANDGKTNLLFETTVDDAGAAPAGDNPLGALLPDATERQRRFFEASFMCSAISANALQVPGNKVLRLTIDMTEYVDDGEGDELPPVTFIATVTFDSQGMPGKIELADQNGPVDISELPQIEPIQ